MLKMSLGVARHRLMERIDTGEELLEALDQIDSFEALQRAWNKAMQWADDVALLASRVAATDPPRSPEVHLTVESRRELVAALRRDAKDRLAWLNNLLEHCVLPSGLADNGERASA